MPPKSQRKFVVCVCASRAKPSCLGGSRSWSSDCPDGLKLSRGICSNGPQVCVPPVPWTVLVRAPTCLVRPDEHSEPSLVR